MIPLHQPNENFISTLGTMRVTSFWPSTLFQACLEFSFPEHSGPALLKCGNNHIYISKIPAGLLVEVPFFILPLKRPHSKQLWTTFACIRPLLKDNKVSAQKLDMHEKVSGICMWL
ncbi:uncharacterized protein LOC111811536 [Cucurbita pepo subsp. pepo]|uniref:uncharacterized protein LOC111811536 n=1 Tax=Cucurbita pepo subsp. pepo TaxID=3664 RepID=UPI000C9D9F16|nr:uncharacterized protein LOC111811536 [Cucurbita pepo subsp. pepo]